MTPNQKSKEIDSYNELFMTNSLTYQAKPYKTYYERIIGESFNTSEPSIKKVTSTIKETPINTKEFKFQVYPSLILSGITNVIEKQNLDKEDKDLIFPILAIMSFYKGNKHLIARKSQILSRAVATGNTSKLNARDKKILPTYKKYFTKNKEVLNNMLKEAQKQINVTNKEIKSNLAKSIRKDLTNELNKKVIDKVDKGGGLQTFERKQTYQEVRQNMIDKYGQQIDSRVQRIINTETKQLQENVKIQHHEYMGYTHKKWNTQLDKNVRKTHKSLQGKTIPIDKKFRVGGKWGMFPGDKSLPLKETINERCYLTYIKR